jgi:hypothetical protein
MAKIRNKILAFKAIKPKQIMDDKINDGIPKIWTNLASSDSVIAIDRTKYNAATTQKSNPIKKNKIIKTFRVIYQLPAHITPAVSGSQDTHYCL